MKTLGKVDHTLRGFEVIDFKDIYNVQCSLQMSSLAESIKPGVTAIWLGCNKADPRVLEPGKGWIPVEMPPDYSANTRMHLHRNQIPALIAHLQSWLDNGTFKIKKATNITKKKQRRK